jgi:hypothetical protein
MKHFSLHLSPVSQHFRISAELLKLATVTLYPCVVCGDSNNRYFLLVTLFELILFFLLIIFILMHRKLFKQ